MKKGFFYNNQNANKNAGKTNNKGEAQIKQELKSNAKIGTDGESRKQTELKPWMLENTMIINDASSYQGNNSSLATECSEQVSENDRHRLQQRIKEIQSQFYMNQILQFIYDVADRNQVYKCNFIHLHIPLALVLKLLDNKSKTAKKEATYLRCVIRAICQKISTHASMRRQMKQQDIENFVIFIHGERSEDQVIKYLHDFLIKNKELMMGFMPYYYNYFALVVNKEIAFLGKRGDLLQYSIDYQHTYYNGTFQRKDVLEILSTFQKKLVEKYHSKDI